MGRKERKKKESWRERTRGGEKERGREREGKRESNDNCAGSLVKITVCG